MGHVVSNWQSVDRRAVRRALISTVCLVSTISIAFGCGTEKAPPAPVAETAAQPDASGRGAIVGRAPAGATVTLEQPGSETPLPPGNAVLDQFGKAFVPAFLIVRVGQPVEFRNSEDTDHNVNVVRVPTGTSVFSTSTPPFQTYMHTFKEQGRFDVSCDIHPGMRAIILATTAPYAVVADAGGQFSFQDLEPGTYTLTVTIGERQSQRTIEVKATRQDVGVVTL